MSYIDDLKPYIAESGLLKIDDDDSQVIDGIETCENENGIYFLALAAIVAKRTGEDYLLLKPAAIRAIHNTKIKHGLYGRNVHGHPIRDNKFMLNSFDNLLGMCACALLFELGDVIEELNDYGSKHWYNFNNSEAGFDIKAQIQGGEIQILKLAHKHLNGKGSGTNPMLMTWFLGGLKLSMDNSKQDKNSSQGLLQWCRYWCLRHMKEEIDGMSGWMWDQYGPTFEDKYMARWKSVGRVFKKYFWDGHPMVKQAQKIDGIL